MRGIGQYRKKREKSSPCSDVILSALLDAFTVILATPTHSSSHTHSEQKLRSSYDPTLRGKGQESKWPGTPPGVIAGGNFATIEELRRWYKEPNVPLLAAGVIPSKAVRA